MPFLTLNGHTFRVADASPRRRVITSGRRKRAYRGQMRNATRGQRREWRLRTCISNFSMSDNFISMINGEGHLVRFVEGWDAATALQPEVGNLQGSRFDVSKAGPFSGFPDGAFVSDGDGLILRYDPQLTDEHTVHLWFDVDNSGWEVHTFIDDGSAWRNGVRDDTLWPFSAGNFVIEVRNGRVEIHGLGSDPTALRHLAMLPYRANHDVVVSWHASTKPFGDLPLLRMEGDMLLTDHEFVFGEVVDVTFVEQGNVDGFGWQNNANVIDFTLIEYATAFRSFPNVPGSAVSP
jgi:hypothetical protein